MKKINPSLYMAIVYLICAIAFTMLAVTSKPLYGIVAVLFFVPSVYHILRYLKMK